MEGDQATPTRRGPGSAQHGSSGRSLGWQDGVIPGLGSGSMRSTPITQAPNRYVTPSRNGSFSSGAGHESGASGYMEVTPHLRRDSNMAVTRRALPAPPASSAPHSRAPSGSAPQAPGASIESLQKTIDEIRRVVETQTRTINTQNERLRDMQESGNAYGARISNLETDHEKRMQELDAAVKKLQMQPVAGLPQAYASTPAQLPATRTPLSLTNGTPAPMWDQNNNRALMPAGPITTPNPRDDVFLQQPQPQPGQQRVFAPPHPTDEAQRAHQQLVQQQLQHQRSAHAPVYQPPAVGHSQPETPRTPADIAKPKSIGDIHITICGKIETFVSRYCTLELPERSRDVKVYDLFQECRKHVDQAWRARALISSPTLRRFLYTGVLHRVLHDTILSANVVYGFRCDQSDKYTQARYEEQCATNLLTGANDYKLRGDLAKRRASLASIIIYETKGFHGWMGRNATERAQQLMLKMDPLIPTIMNIDAANELSHIVHELYRLAARLACEPYFYSTQFYAQNVTFDHKNMIHRNPEYNGARIENEPSKHVVLCTMVPEFVQKDFTDGSRMNKKYLHKAEVLIADRAANLR